MRNSVIPSVNILIIDKNKILLSKRRNTGWMDGYLCIPGGHVEENETPRQAALREIKEELDIDVKADELEFVCVVARDKKPDGYVAYEFKINGHNIKYKNAEPEKCEELIWANLDNLPEKTITVFKDIINKSYFGGKKYLETNY